MLQGELADVLRQLEEMPAVPVVEAFRPHAEVMDAVVAGEDAEMAARRRSRLLARRRELEAAIALADAGQYGVCQDCGEEIPVARLKALPATDRCVSCAAAAERGEEPERRGIDRVRRQVAKPLAEQG